MPVMADEFEKIRSIVTEVLDREADVARVALSGPWPAFVLDTELWVPARIYVGKFSSDRLPPQFWQFLTSRGGPAAQERIREFVRRTPAAADVTQVEFTSYPERKVRAGIVIRRAILVNGVEEIGVLDPTGYVTVDQPRLIQSIQPSSSEVLARWSDVERSLSEERTKRAWERDDVRRAREQLNERLCQALVSHLSRDSFSCPFCRRSSRSYRFMGSHFICWGCGRSFFPADLPPGTIPSP